MFRDFSFDAASPPSYSAYEADRAAMNVSPTSKPDAQQFYMTRPPTPSCSIGDLAAQLNQQSLRIEPRQDKIAAGLSTPPSDDYSESLECAAPQPSYSRVSASLLRMQRQSSARRQCSPSFVRDISRMVQMIEEEEQCTINDASSRSSSTSNSSSRSTSTSSDEAIDMDYDIAAQGVEALIGMPRWRASDRRDNCVRVTKSVRMRKRSGDKVHKRRSS
ncbi:hypothetical protein EK21DRAFT_59644 [Setomelanomma holmii]|uniref:Uncharacterized protein n=1 Tax=Setomelanomma holmii TaxID=210430 RepID=A0A9P4HF96_9PLEO|nr:hypothetical protein EK21DRAFT_59644 [Setomelanomma holmii]